MTMTNDGYEVRILTSYKREEQLQLEIVVHGCEAGTVSRVAE